MATPQPQLKAVEILPELAVPTDWRKPGYIQLQRDDFYALARRCTGIMLAILLYIEDRTQSMPDRLKEDYAQIPMNDWRKLTGASVSTIEHTLGKAEKAGFIEREKSGKHHDRGGYRLRYGRFGEQPLPAPRVRKCSPREESVRVAVPIAAFRQPQSVAVCDGTPQPQLNAVTPGDDQPQLITVGLHSDALETAKSCTVPGGCPYLYTGSTGNITAAAAEPQAAADQTEESKRVQESLASYGPADPDTARRVIQECRKRYPSATVEDIQAKISEKGKAARKADNPIGFLVKVVPPAFEGFQPKPQAKTRREQDIAYLLTYWDEYPNEERLEYLKAFPELASMVKSE